MGRRNIEHSPTVPSTCFPAGIVSSSLRGQKSGDQYVSKDGGLILVVVLAYNLENSISICSLTTRLRFLSTSTSSLDVTTVKLRALISRVSVQVDILAAMRLKFVLSGARMNAGL